MDTMDPGIRLPYPGELINWAGNRSGGVRRLFDDSSGRPGKTVFETNLLHRLQDWANALSRGDPSAPRILLLVGGPGNGKTEAIESTVGWLDEALAAQGQLIAALKECFTPLEDEFVPRLVRIDAGALGSPARNLNISIVQDASTVVGTGKPHRLLLDELENMQSLPSGEAYLCCVNRGILDDALIEAIDNGAIEQRKLLEAITRSVSLAPEAPSCWPLQDYPEVAVWPMDVESLLLAPARGGEAPARSVLQTALDAQKWPEADSCPAGPRCPFCSSRLRLSRDREEGSFLKILRWHEVASGKRWNFRDLFSLMSYLLAGHRVEPAYASLDPCDWAAKLISLDDGARPGARPSAATSSAIFQLVASQYQHALFHKWEKSAASAILKDIKELDLEDDNTAMGLYHFLSGRKSPYLPSMISDALDGLADSLDPALALPDTVVQATRNTSFALRDLDVRFSRSVSEGFEFIRKLQIISRLESDLLDRLAKLDELLSTGGVRRRRPGSATNIQRFIRDFACRLVRRSLGTRIGVVQDAQVLAEFQRVVEDIAGEDLYDVAHEVEQLLNKNQDFEISLTTTFGQPLPPPIRQATLVVAARSVRPRAAQQDGRPTSPFCYLTVGEGKSSKTIVLTYDLFKAVKELDAGMSAASLPRTVQALLDTTRARLSGPTVRDEVALERARIRIGTSGTSVVQKRDRFGVRREITR
ncbi:hypothetical protein HA464_29550 (plasmid) [Rhizobium leguminosarum bv. trifolii]|uniref:hypothetical protein n=1 Tax=Rhizobium ruizarguesonis TaxID=2081791 RepID=UPI0010302EB9|nr:hypothetical protein [Rhizobium ruizarguesonis]QIO48166.1 hypothetical protein HA464_29550 [Rhizobium leguminosarum bv. trifolii]TAW39108.1 hypothetical protein ELI17_36890 [Rhizobium ruizarguesonis]TAY06461.1 hypothetical protein ELH92_36775 [Rhizobium ruizarguesonis]